MRVGLVAEGVSDLAVLRNLLRGVLGIEGHDVQDLRPDLSRDETDLNDPALRFSNWELVMHECRDRTLIDEFLGSPVTFDDDDGQRWVVVHLDSAECELAGYDVQRPPPTATDRISLLIAGVRAKIAAWLGDTTRIVRAVAVEETDAWLLALHEDRDSSGIQNPKRAWERCAPRLGIHVHGLSVRQRYDRWSAAFRKKKERNRARTRNPSLDALVLELESMTSSG